MENRYDMVKDFMNELSAHLYGQGLTTSLITASSACIESSVPMPEVLRQHLFTCDDGLIPRRYVKCHHMVLEIAR